MAVGIGRLWSSLTWVVDVVGVGGVVVVVGVVDVSLSAGTVKRVLGHGGSS